MSATKSTNYICNLWRCVSNFMVRSNNTNHYSEQTQKDKSNTQTQTQTQTEQDISPRPTQLTIPLPTIEWKDTQAFIPPICEGQVIKILPLYNYDKIFKLIKNLMIHSLVTVESLQMEVFVQNIDNFICLI